MTRRDVTSLPHAYAFALDCQLATVAMLAKRKVKGKKEYARQIAIAQGMFDTARIYQVDTSKTRAVNVPTRPNGVATWAAQFESK